MPEKTPDEILGDPVLRSEYRVRLAHALKVAKGYHGTEPEYQDLMKTLADLERWLNGAFGQSEGLRFPENLESEVAGAWQKTGRRKIFDVLELSGGRLSRHISETLKGKEASVSGLLTVDMEGVILPPEEGRIQPVGEKGESLEPVRFQERVKELVMALGEKGIRTDDIVLVRGNVRESMMRKISYVILEIPKLNREVLVCDQVGEATFVIYGIQSRQMLMSEGKEKLQERLGACALKIVYRDPDQWKKEVIDRLLKDMNIEKLKKVDVRSQEGLRTEILRLIPTPEAWMSIKTKEKRSFEVAGMGLTAVARKFGVEGSPFKQSTFMKIGKEVYGAGHGCLEYEGGPEMSMDELRAKILSLVPTPEAWAGMKRKEAFKAAGMGLIAIARKFDIKENPFKDPAVHTELGRKIYGEGHNCLQYEEKSELTAEELRLEILKQVPTSEAWAGMKAKKKLAFEIAGLRLTAVARKLGVCGGNPRTNHKFHLELGKKIYGEGHECLREVDLGGLRAAILELCPTPEAWAEMTAKKKGAFRVAGIGLEAVATKFEVKGLPVSYHSAHLKLGREIYGQEHESLNELNLERLKREIIKLYPTPEAWAGMTAKKKLAFEVAGLGLTAVARKLGVCGGNPRNNHKFHLELGEKIYEKK